MSFALDICIGAGNGSRNLNDNEHEKREISSEEIVDNNSHPTDDPREEPRLEERFLDTRDKVQDCDSCQREMNSRSGHEEKVSNQENLTENARLNDHRDNNKEGLGGSRRSPAGSRRRISLDMDSSTGKESIFVVLSFCNLIAK